MNDQEFQTIVKEAAAKANLPEALKYFQSLEHEEISEAANALSGQFVLAEVEAEQRVYHVTLELNDEGEETEYYEHVMNQNEETILFVSWFFETQFDMKRKEIYAAAGRTYKQVKRS